MKEHPRHFPALATAYSYGKALSTLAMFHFRTKRDAVEHRGDWSFSTAVRLGEYMRLSSQIPGWARGEEAAALVAASFALSDSAIIVEIGSFLGSSAVLLAGARRLKKSGRVHCVDSFDATGDGVSAPVYREIRDSLGVSLRRAFDQNLRRAGLAGWVEVHEGQAVAVAANWAIPVDMLFLDGDHSHPGVQAIYHAWIPFLRIGGLLAVHNSSDRVYEEGHDGSRRLVLGTIHPPRYTGVRCFGSTTFARKTSDHDA